MHVAVLASKGAAFRSACTGSFWIDKFCIDQEHIQESLKYLPVFVMASNKMLVLVGPTYFQRLCEYCRLFCSHVATKCSFL